MEKTLAKLIDFMKELRSSDKPCPWTKAQTFSSLSQQTLEETYELIEAIENEYVNAIKEELGDLLYHIVFYCEIAEELSLFSFENVSQSIIDKLQRRLPEADKRKHFDVTQLNHYWQQAKAKEKKQSSNKFLSVLKYLPALTAANRIQGFAITPPLLTIILSKINKQIAQLSVHSTQDVEPEQMSSIVGYLLFMHVILANQFAIDPEAALRKINLKIIAYLSKFTDNSSQLERLENKLTLDEFEKWLDKQV